MNKYGQAEYAYGILRQISEKLLAEGILTEEQLKQLNVLNKEGCFRQFSQLWRRDFVGFGDTIFQEKVVLCM